MNILKLIIKVIWTLTEPIQFAAGLILGIAFGLVTLCFDALVGIVYLILIPVFLIVPLILFLAGLYWLGQLR